MLLAFALLSVACNPIKSKWELTLFDDTFRLYSKHLRWGHFREISGMMTDRYVTESLAKIPRLKNIRVSRVEGPDWIVNENKDNISGTVEVSYYLADQGVIRQTTQQQTWIYRDNRWQLDAPLPDFR